jgi:XTP/dITP diphosphohydrolase
VDIVLGTTNPAKARFLAWLIEGLGLSYRTAEGLGPPPPETGASLVENARLKAQHWSRRTNGLAIASDGGLHIPALGRRWSPLHTHRFAGPEASDADRARALLDLMRDLRGQERCAYFVEVVALADRGQLLAEWQAQGEPCRVIEALPEQTAPGFWADSLLVPLRAEALSADFPPDATALGQSGAWAKLRPLVQAFLREWLVGRGSPEGV